MTRKKPRAEGGTFETVHWSGEAPIGEWSEPGTARVASAPPIKLIEGLWWPERVGESYKRYLARQYDSDKAIRLCDRDHRRTAVQAGGHVGLWPRRLSAKFARVVTFEPEAANFACLLRNIEGISNIEAHQHILGEAFGTASLDFNARNTGGHKPIYNGNGDRTMVSIDTYNLDDVDLLCLDIEGGELPALKGAVETLKRCKPIILTEMRGHGERLGYSDADLVKWIKAHGYKDGGKVQKDRMWLPV
jgi:FkbM family methyltransferase